MKALAFYSACFGFSLGTLVMGLLHVPERAWHMPAIVCAFGLVAWNAYRRALEGQGNE